MTAQRLVRSGKARIFLVINAVLLVLVAIYHHENVVSECDNLKKRHETCTQQAESLSVNLQVIVDYKNKLEKSLQQEKSEHKQTRTELEAKVNNEKVQRDKTSEDANKRFATLQQHYKLLQTVHDDWKAKAEKLEEDVEQMQIRIKELEDNLKVAESEKQKSLEKLKNEYMQLQVNNEELESKLKGHDGQQGDWESQVNHLTKERNQLLREINLLKNKPDAAAQSIDEEPARLPQTSPKNFNQQVEVTENVYQIKDSKNIRLEAPVVNQHKEDQSMDILARPNVDMHASPKTSSSGALAGAQPIVQPTATPETKRGAINGDVAPAPKKKIPRGVVPFPNKEGKSEDKNIPDEVNLALPNRYRNNIIDTEIQIQNENKEDKTRELPRHALDELQDKNNAQEVMDQPRAMEPRAEENEPPAAPQHRRRAQDPPPADTHVGLNKPPGQYEAEGDYDKDAHKEDLQIDENEQEAEGEEDDDGDDDYMAARQKEPAVRN